MRISSRSQHNSKFLSAFFTALAVLPVYGETAGDADFKRFQSDIAAQFQQADKNADTAIRGKDGWLFFVPEVHSVSAGKFWGEEARNVSQAVDLNAADPLPAILDFKAQLEKAGIKLLLVPVPPKSVIYADKLSNKIPATAGVLPRYDPYHREFYQLLRDNGVDVLDLTDEFLQHRQDASGAPYCKQDTHWSGRGLGLAAKAIAEKLKGTPWPAATHKTKAQTKERKVTFAGDLWDSLPVKGRPAQEALSLRFVGTTSTKKPGELVPITPDKSSPVVLLGDSHTLVFQAGGEMHFQGAGLADQLLVDLGFPVDLIGVLGSGATPARQNLMRRTQRDAAYLKGKKWVVWCFSAREWTESAGWQKVPVVR